SVSLIRSASDWKIIDPVKTPADQSAAEQVVSAGAALSSEKELGDISDPAEFGLKTPTELTFVLASNQTRILKIGDKTPNGSGYYVMAGDAKKAFTIESRSAESMLKSLFDLRGKKLLAFDTLSTASFEIEALGAALSAERVKEGNVKPEDARWRIVKPDTAEADKGEVIKLLSRVTEAKAESFVEESAADLARYGLEKPEITVRLVSDDGKKAGLMIGSSAPEGGKYARIGDSGAVIRISADVASTVSESVAKLRLTTFTGVDRSKIKRIRLETANGSYTAERKKAEKKDDDDEWKFIEPAGMVADSLLFSALAYDIERARYSRMIPRPEKLSTYGLDKPSFTLTVTLDGAETTILAAYKEDKQGYRYYASAPGRAEVFEIEKSTFDSLAKTAHDFENRRFFIVRSDNVGRIVVKRLGQVFDISREGEGFALKSPEKRIIPVEKWREFAWKIIEMKYETLRQGPQGATGVEKPSLAISVYNASGELVDEVSVGGYDQARDFYFAKSSKKNAVLAVNSRFVKEDVINYLETLIGIDER
ncbi:MAG: DUF4340 domain-containing protein, partial [Nitrospinae bacterium]|nr:DUF4340 domain-containing protein [Nitrospinota bacterium]